MVRKAKPKSAEKRRTRRTKTRASRKGRMRKVEVKFDEKELTKGQLRKLNALRRSVGDELGEKTFAEWLKKQNATKVVVPEDKNAALIAETLIKLVDDKNLRLPRGGYVVTRGKGRIVVKKAQGD